MAVLRPFKWLRFIHDKIKLLDINQLEPATNPYGVLVEWLVEIIQYGCLMAFCYLNFIVTGWIKWAMLPISLGIIRWLWLDILEHSSRAIKQVK